MFLGEEDNFTFEIGEKVGEPLPLPPHSFENGGLVLET